MIKVTKTIRSIIRRLGSDSNGAAVIEYGLLAALVSTAFIMGAISLGTSINGVNEASSSQIDIVIAAMTGSNPAAENNDKGGGGKGDKGGKGGKGKKGNKGNHGTGNNGNGND